MPTPLPLHGPVRVAVVGLGQISELMLPALESDRVGAPVGVPVGEPA